MLNLIPKSKSVNMSGVYDPETGEFHDGIEASQIINKFFTQIGQKLNEKLPIMNNNYSLIESASQMPPMRDIDVFAVDLHISHIDINKSSGLSSLSAKLLKIALNCQLVRFIILVKLCIRTCIFPLAWKIGTVVPLPKKGDTRLVTNLRPVTLLPVPGKILEKFLLNQLSKFLEDNNILTQHQGGFRKKHSTQLSAFNLCNVIAHALNSNQYSVVTYLDVSKALTL